MSGTINYLCDGFNDHIGKISQILIHDNSTKRSEISRGFFDVVVNSAAVTVDFQVNKAFMAYNIKATIYNVATVIAIASIVGTIFGGPLGLASLALSVMGRMFVHHSMDRTCWGSIGNHHQVADNTIYSLLFKSFIPMPEHKFNF